MAAALVSILLVFLELTCAGRMQSDTNIARGGIVTQSSINGDATPWRAIDGRRAGEWLHKSCTLTQLDNCPWWRLDLLNRYKIYTVTITNREDCCSERLDGAEIHIGDSLEDNGNANPRCAVISRLAPGASRSFRCEGMVGQYINIVIPNRREYLTLCEVEVTGEPAGNTSQSGDFNQSKLPRSNFPYTNIARGGIVTQSSINGDATPGRAIDGRRAGEWLYKSCTLTQLENRPWWRLDLLNRYKIYTVTITNREDCCSERLDSAEIHIGDSLEDNGNANPRCAVISRLAPGASRTFRCEGMVGQYINIVIPNRREYLTLCEVEVTGEPAGNTSQSEDFNQGNLSRSNFPYTNIARGGIVIQSSINGDATAGRAIDGRHAGEWLYKSCTLTQLENRPWWRLDLLNRYKIYNVTITNREDCCSERLDGAEIHIGDSLEDNGNANPRCAVISRLAPGASRTFRCEGMVGQYINIVIPNRREYLTLCEVEVTGEPAGNTSQSGDFNQSKLPRSNFPYTNIARGGIVTQSSINGDATPGRAIDGRRAGEWLYKSCTLTQLENRPWWRLDLLNRYKIYNVTITNREDCCSERLDGAEIHIGDSLEDNGNANPRCAVISRLAPGASRTFRCEGMVGQYINIVIPNRREYLTLCEVEVTGEPAGNTSQSEDFNQSKLPRSNFPYTNIARGGIVTQSSINGDAAPGRAIDGRRAGEWLYKSCTLTQLENSPWWRLDLLNRYKIYTVTITNREDCCSERLDGAEIHIGDSLEDNSNVNPRCAVISRLAPGASKTFRCEGMVGQYINIVIPNRREYLTLCEVEVTGEPAGNTSQSEDFNQGKLPRSNFPYTNIARGGIVTQSSINGDATPGRAIDGRHVGEWLYKSCTLTQLENSPWWRLDLLNRYKIYNVTITNREDCCSERLDGAEIHIGDSLEDNGNANPRCAVISRLAPGASKTFRCEGMVGQYINIVIPNRREYLTLCEVEVTGEPAGNTSQSEDFNQGKLPRSNFPYTNIARGGIVTQSSINGDATPGRAIDGRHVGEWLYKSCTLTQLENRPWWRLDLLNRYKIYNVTITNREDCCSERLDGAEIHIGDSLEDNGNANPRCAVISRLAPGASKTFRCEGMVGQYITIVIPNRREYLTLCEVEVTGEPAENTSQSGDFNQGKLPRSNFPYTNIARGGIVTQSSINGDAAPGRAIDGRRAGEWLYKSCTLTQLENRPWWRLDLLNRYKIYTVTITNREDCCSERLDGAEIHIGDSQEDNGNANPRCAVISRLAPGASKTFRCEGMVGQYINIVIPNRREYLTLCEVEVTGEPAGNTSQSEDFNQSKLPRSNFPYTNIARGGIVTQSSINGDATAARAIDGRRAGEWLYKSCTLTQLENRPWWRLNLLNRYKIYTVTITNREDCCSERLDGAEIHIGDSLEDNGNANPRCAVISRLAPGASKTFRCEGMVGQYINIVIPNRREYLTLCEVEVTGEPAENTSQSEDFNQGKLPRSNFPYTNIARGGIVTQSSINGDATPGRAIDGRHAGEWLYKSCTLTQLENRPWWRLDLLNRYKIYNVTITNREDCCSERLDGAEIHIGDSLEDNGNANPRCAVISRLAPGASKTFRCEGMVGQYINIVIPNRREYLTLCEVEVTGEPAGNTSQSGDFNQSKLPRSNFPYTNIARGGIVTQSSINGDATPGRAIDGRRAGEWLYKSCTLTQLENRPWWRLNLLNRYKIYNVTITNREDCCSERLDGAEIHIGDSLEDNGNANPRCAVISRLAPGASKTFRCEGMVGQYINIVIPNRREYLTLCEVEVTGEPAGNTSQSEDFNQGKLPRSNFPYTNIARGGIVTQSSINDDATPGRAIDGRHAGEWLYKSCTLTQLENRPWWRLDLLNRYKIYNVTITNREDCCSERLDGAEIHIGDSLEDNGNANPRCAVISRLAPGASKTVRCEGMEGQYINIVIPNRREYLTLCEVEVTGEPAGNICLSTD